jgi:predicted TIM-barrel fold metal-dependent hydrolase
MPAVFIHTGTTPFCPGGLFGNLGACCDDKFVNLTRLEPLIAQYDNIPWVLLHSGYDFTPTSRTDITDAALDLASKYANVYLEVSPKP